MWIRVFCVWLIIMACETLMGVLRAVVVAAAAEDDAGREAFELAARRVGVFLGSGMILLVSWVMVGWLISGSSSKGRVQRLLGVGAMWGVMTVGFEVGIGWLMMRQVDGGSGHVWGLVWKRMGEDYDIRRGGLMWIGMAVLILAPLIAAKVRGLLKRDTTVRSSGPDDQTQ